MKAFAVALAAAAFLSSAAVHAQSAPPYGRFTTEVTGTITSTGVYQSVLVASTNGVRMSCLIQNNGAHAMLVFWGSAQPASNSGKGFVLTAGNAVSCGLPGTGVALDQVWIEGTSGDTFEYSSQP